MSLPIHLCEVVILFLSMKFHSASCDVFYIVTTANSPCPGEFIGVPCLTLQQYASNPSQSENITFQVEPGTYYLSTELTVSNGYNFTMSSNNATVTCTSSTAHFLFDTVQNVHISGMTFQKCRSSAIRMMRVINGHIMNSNFIENGYYSYGALYISYCTLVTIRESVFRGNTGYWGAAISAYYSSNVTINRSLLTNNRGYPAGCIYYISPYNIMHSVFTVDNSVFSHNVIQYYSGGNGGAIHIEANLYTPRNTMFTINQCQFISNSATQSGGAIYITGRNHLLTIINNYYYNNTANTFGAAVYAAGENSSVSVTDSSFINNTVIRGGGAIYSNGRYANVSLSSSTFNYNSASYCSVLDVDNFNHFSVNLTNSLFTYNTATGQTIGGGVACIRNASINIINSVFKHNFAYYHAGVFYIDESVTTVDGSIFINNSAALDGGVFYTYVHASDYIITRSQFSGNAAGDDGGVMLIGRLNCFVSIDESIFDFNSAADRGGVIALIASSMYMEINRTNIFNNTAQFGSVISACNSQVTFVEDVLTATVDPILSFCTLYGGNIHNFDITIPTPEIATTAPPTTTEVPTTTDSEMLTAAETHRSTTTESPTTTSPSTRITILTTTEPHTTIKPPDMTPTSPSRTTQPNMNMTHNTTVTTPPATLVIYESTSVSPTTDTTSPILNSNPTNIEQTSTPSRPLDENHAGGQSTTAEHTLHDESFVTVMVVVTDSRVTATIIISTTCLVVSLGAIMIVLVPRFRRCLCQNQRNNYSKASTIEDSKTDELTTTDQSSLPTYTSPVFDPDDDDDPEKKLI